MGLGNCDPRPIIMETEFNSCDITNMPIECYSCVIRPDLNLLIPHAAGYFKESIRILVPTCSPFSGNYQGSMARTDDVVCVFTFCKLHHNSFWILFSNKPKIGTTNEIYKLDLISIKGEHSTYSAIYEKYIKMSKLYLPETNSGVFMSVMSYSISSEEFARELWKEVIRFKESETKAVA